MSAAEATLRHCLSPRVRRWAMAEWHYSALDRPWFMRNELQVCHQPHLTGSLSVRGSVFACTLSPFIKSESSSSCNTVCKLGKCMHACTPLPSQPDTQTPTREMSFRALRAVNTRFLKADTINIVCVFLHSGTSHKNSQKPPRNGHQCRHQTHTCDQKIGGKCIRIMQVSKLRIFTTSHTAVHPLTPALKTSFPGVSHAHGAGSCDPSHTPRVGPGAKCVWGAPPPLPSLFEGGALEAGGVQVGQVYAR